MDHIPLFARAGAVVPMWPQAPASTDGHHPDTVELHLFVPATDGRHESVLREDDGLTFAADQGRHLRTTLVVERNGDSVTVRAAVEGGDDIGPFRYIEHAVDGERGDLPFAGLARLVNPLRLERTDVFARELREERVAVAGVVAAEGEPVARLVGGAEEARGGDHGLGEGERGSAGEQQRNKETAVRSGGAGRGDFSHDF